LCNIALIQENQTILDPFAGSATTLLAATLISPSVRTVGVEIDEFISRSSIMEDFSSRGAAEPVALLQGDIMDRSMRDNARAAIGDMAFDVIITDPPYGRREAAVVNRFYGLADALLHSSLAPKIPMSWICYPPNSSSHMLGSNCWKKKNRSLMILVAGWCPFSPSQALISQSI